MKHKTSELTGALLDAAVAKAAGMSFEVVPQKVWGDGSGITIVSASPACMVNHAYFEPSMSWADGGPIIERERIGTSWDYRSVPMAAWEAEFEHDAFEDGGATRTWAYGETPLMAAMRAFVTAKLGAEVDL